jgi:hypothetical protein
MAAMQMKDGGASLTVPKKPEQKDAGKPAAKVASKN